MMLRAPPDSIASRSSAQSEYAMNDRAAMKPIVPSLVESASMALMETTQQSRLTAPATCMCLMSFSLWRKFSI